VNTDVLLNKIKLNRQCDINKIYLTKVQKKIRKPRKVSQASQGNQTTIGDGNDGGAPGQEEAIETVRMGMAKLKTDTSSQVVGGNIDLDNNIESGAPKREESRVLVSVLSKQRSKFDDDRVVIRAVPKMGGYGEYYLVSPKIKA